MNNINEAKAIPTRFTSNGSALLTKSVAIETRGRIAAQACTDQMIADKLLWTDFVSPAGKTGESTSTPAHASTLTPGRCPFSVFRSMS